MNNTLDVFANHPRRLRFGANRLQPSHSRRLPDPFIRSTVIGPVVTSYGSYDDIIAVRCTAII